MRSWLVSSDLLSVF